MYVNQNKGICAGLAAGIFWATPFFVPIVLVDYSAFEIMFGRFFFFALVSAFYLPRIIRVLRELTRGEFFKLFLLSASGYWLYTFVLFSGIKLTNGVISSLILGCTPITIILFSKPYFNVRFASGLLLILIGMGFLLVLPVWKGGVGVGEEVSILGIILLFMALALWTWFGIKNSHFMHRHPHIKASDYSSTMGLLSFLIVLPIFVTFYDFSAILHHTHAAKFLLGTAILGIGASWIANMLWVYSSKNCPSSIIGSLLISETLFALIYSFIYAGRAPKLHECIAMMALILGVVLVVASQKST